VIHELGQPEKLRTVTGKNGWYRVSCSCGNYVGPAKSTPGEAMKPGIQHIHDVSTQKEETP